MADKLTSIAVGNSDNDKFHSGKTWNVYDSYAHAISHGATGLMTIKDYDHITGVAGSAISQVSKQVGVVPDQNGRLNFVVDNGADIFVITEGYGVPIQVRAAAI